MKAMAGELNMNQTQTNEYKQEIDRLNNELHCLKHKYFEQKRKEALAKEKELNWIAENSLTGYMEKSITENTPGTEVLGPRKTRFVGGGFAVK